MRITERWNCAVQIKTLISNVSGDLWIIRIGATERKRERGCCQVSKGCGGRLSAREHHFHMDYFRSTYILWWLLYSRCTCVWANNAFMHLRVMPRKRKSLQTGAKTQIRGSSTVRSASPTRDFSLTMCRINLRGWKV